MPTSFTETAPIRVRQALSANDAFSLKTDRGGLLGFALNASRPGPTLLIALTGGTSQQLEVLSRRIVFARNENKRLALIQLDGIEGARSLDLVKSITDLLHPVSDTKFIALQNNERTDGTFYLAAIAEFCAQHECKIKIKEASND